MPSYEAFEEILKAKGKTRADVCTATGIRSGVFSDWKAGRYQPKQDKIEAIAKYLNVPVHAFDTIDVTIDATDTYESAKQYYTDMLTSIQAQEMFEDKRLRALQHIKRNMDSDRFQIYYDMLVKMYQKEHPTDDYDFDE